MSLQEKRLESDNFDKFQCPCRILVTGSTSCGKSFFIKRLLEHRQRLFSAIFQRVLIIIPPNSRHQRSEYLESLEKICPNIEIIQGFPPSLEALHLTGDAKESKLLILDDLIGKKQESIMNL